ncbi:MAG: hypothetical protein A2X12_00670 [Bacteroidetes bacterium GWE2_29_8]|nr:MAG: hypothetical protein A2X12_00670 [Bacteroidetes bacterium GWE2_29_8]OFY20647.1 MAG: hypothetical protein A2X02_06190 [Bacteroidetes bacterium GWF2_29_10]
MVENKKKYIILIISIITIAIYSYNVFIQNVQTDEAWAHSATSAKIKYKYYTMPAFYDMEIFKEKPYYMMRTIDQLYRASILINGEGPNSVKFVRLIAVIFLLSSLFYYLKNQNYIKETFDRIIAGCIMLLLIFITGAVNGREELFITSVLLFIMGIISKYRNSEGVITKKTEVIILAFLCFCIHPNGIFILFALSLLMLNIKKIQHLIKYYILILLLLYSYYVFLIDYNLVTYQEQFILLTQSGEEQKFITSIGDFFVFLKNELSRYSIQRMFVNIYYLFVSLNLIVFVIGGIIVGFLNKKQFKTELFFSATLFFGLIFIGNKSSIYLAYLIPFTFIMFIVFILNKINNKHKILLLLSIFVMLFFTSIGSIYKTQNYNKEYNQILEFTYKNVPLNSKVYAPFRFEPYLSKKYEYYTTTHKDRVNAYNKFNIDLRNSYVISSKKDGIWDYIDQKKYDCEPFNNSGYYKIIHVK